MKIKILSILALLLTMVQGAWADDKADYGVLNGEFSVSAVKKVHFSKGNLRAFYNSSKSWEWYFPTNQYDYVGNAIGNTAINGKGSLSSTDQSVDLFGWSTSSTSYGIYNSEDNSEYSDSLLDWGTNAITNGGSKANIWYTPSQDEWTYLMSTRSTTTTNMPTGTNSDYARYIKAQVASENGLILFPDKYAHPADASVTVSSAAYNTANKGYGSFTVDAENWTKMEEAGAVFLPAGGYRHGTTMQYAGTYGAYWSSTSTSSDKATSMDFSSSKVEAYNTNRSTGCSVRLVIESHTITYNANGGEGEIASQPKYTDLDRTLSDGTGLSREGYIFDGWATAADGNVVYGPGATYTEEADVTLYAQWTENTATLSQATDNSTFISANNGLVYDITLGRTMNAGGWNTFCVPFDISSSQIESVFGSGTEVRELGSSDFDEGTKALTLNFTEASTIEAGKPYLVYLGSGSNVVNPTFVDVTIVSGTTTKTTDYANFMPVMNPTSLTGGDKSILFVTGGDKLTYPSSTGNINGFRAYFQLHDLPTEARSFAMSFDDETTAVRGIENGETTFGAYGESQLRVENSYYDLQGRRVVQPTKGLYIVNGKKLIIK